MIQPMKLSIILPLYNEEESLIELQQKLENSLSNFDHEIIYINDGSRDQSEKILNEIKKKNANVKVIHFYRNYGQTAAMDAGFKAATGDLLIPMDADLQNDPADIPKLVEKIKEGFDVVSGWRKKRRDNIIRVLPSMFANGLIAKVTRLPLHDLGCSLKAYKKEFLEGVHLYGEMHRFIPVYAFWNGARIGEIEVNHHARSYGHSKYGFSRIWKVLLDLLTVSFLGNYSSKPIYFFGKIAFGSFCLAILDFLFVIYRSVFLGGNWISPLIFVGFFFAGLAVQFLFFGILAEIMIRTFYASEQKMNYRIKPEQKI